ncbi:hypothetical protein DPMN_181061 [Dreissena polymorpha]|uniref:Uncharacterized protein n=1 Tax=Dreissena polymorpha TaxID=45954 RepID=A0A9D4I185_DREPO|nr:hypothetical protein DPMN_181061 [Dreissena polymorpha]
MKYFLGVGRCTPNAAVNGDMGWEPPIVRPWRCIMGHYFRWVHMDSTRLNKHVFVNYKIRLPSRYLKCESQPPVLATIAASGYCSQKNERTDERKKGRTNGRTKEETNERTHGRTPQDNLVKKPGQRKHGQIDGRTNELTDERTDEIRDERAHGQTKEPTHEGTTEGTD